MKIPGALRSAIETVQSIPNHIPRVATALGTTQIAGCSGWGIAGSIVGGLLGATVIWGAIGAGRRLRWRAQCREAGLRAFNNGDYFNAADKFYQAMQYTIGFPRTLPNALTFAAYAMIASRRAGQDMSMDIAWTLCIGTRNEYYGTLLESVMSSIPAEQSNIPPTIGEGDFTDAVTRGFSNLAGTPHAAQSRMTQIGQGPNALILETVTVTPDQSGRPMQPGDDVDPQVRVIEDLLVNNTQIPWQRGDLRRLLGYLEPHFPRSA